MSRLLRNLIKYSLLPAAMMIVAKLFGILLAANIAQIPLWISDDVGQEFDIQIVTLTYDHALYVNSISNVILMIVMSISFFYLFSRYYVYNKVNENPRTIAKITKFNLLSWITSKSVVFTKIFVWGIFLISSASIVVTSALKASTYSWIGISAFIIGILSIWGLIKSFEAEADRVYPKSNKNYF